ncbi:serine/threonine-protein kinase [Acidicapsa ligni]|uniref:serine/threonine-protein kinase n=1 Tax=Acidicapsa ligni TaxID=542300 RepID=UPI0021E0927B|nr:serine/threonine-protein kinase [Acidicapsa ligni]
MSLESDNWDLLQKLFHLAEQTPVEDRKRVLAEACPDAELCRKALEIVDAGDVVYEDKSHVEPPILTGKIGPYTLGRLLGTGGIGSVYLVERVVNGTRLRSALKVLGPHAAGPSFVDRFLREQKILASLEHPNITRMLDAGVTESGQPYLVMEYVEGELLDVYCDAHRLNVSERLRLFLHVCDAVAYAHRNLVVHLDLKPSNILVTGDGTVKLLDFGTSKLMQQNSLLTSTILATPAYASPEQLRNNPLTTASDIYSLGVILFELLSGRRPGGRASMAVMLERAILEQEPERLSKALTEHAAEVRGVPEAQLRQLVKGDLETIVAKCLSPRPEDRYASLDFLAEDIQRYLNGWPVLARPQTTLYLVSKFVRRKRKVVLAALLVLLALVASLAYAGWRQEQAVLEGQRAERMQTFLYRLLYMANSNYTGKPTFTVQDFLELGVKLLPNYIKDPTDLRKAQMSLAESMYENNDLEAAQKAFAPVIASAKAAKDYDTEAESEATAGDTAYLLGETALGLQLTTHALDISRHQGVSPSVRVWSKVYYATNRERLGFRTDENLEMLQSAAKEAQGHNVLPPHETADVLYALGWDLKMRERFAESEGVFNQTLHIYLQDAEAKCDQSAVYGELAAVKDRGGDPQASLPLYQRAYDGLKACEGADSRGALEQQDRMAGALIRVGRAKDGLSMIESAMPGWRKIAGASPDLAEPLDVLSLAYLAMGRFPEAEKSAKELFEVQDGKVSAADRRLGTAQLLWARALVAEHRYPEALPHAEYAARLLTHGVSGEAKRMDSQAVQVLGGIQAKVSQP